MFSPQILSGHKSDLNSVDFNCGKILATASNDKTIRLWQVESDKSIKECSISPLVGHKYGVNFVRFSPFGTILASCSTDGNIILWNAQSGEQVVKLKHKSGEAVRVACFSPSSALLATGGDDEMIVLWDISTRTMIKQLSGHEAMVTAAGFSPDSNYLVTGSTSGNLLLWDAKLTEEKWLASAEEAHDLGVMCLDFSSKFQVNVAEGPLTSVYLLASCGNDDLVKVWHVKASYGRCKLIHSHTLEGHGGNVNCCRFSLDGALLASAAGDKLAIVWDVNTGSILHRLDAHSRFVTCCAFSTDSKLIATGSNDKLAMVWDLENIVRTKSTYSSDTTESLITRSASSGLACPVPQWDVDSVASWLHRLGLEQYKETFIENQVDGSELLLLTSDTIVSQLKIEPLGHRNKILRAIQALKNPLLHNAIASDGNKNTPEELLCPITHEVLRDPVVAADGYTYERSAILKWFDSGNQTSPMSNERMEHSNVIPNKTLKLIMQKYFEIAE